MSPTLDRPGSRLFSAAAQGARAAARPARVAARALRARARAVERGVTRELNAVASEHGATMVGLRYRLKSQASLQRKIVMRMSSRGETPEVAGDRIKDALRYTMTLSDESWRSRSAAASTAWLRTASVRRSR